MSATTLVKNLLREKGIAGLYRGLGPTITRDVTFSAIYFPLFAKFDSLVLLYIILIKFKIFFLIKFKGPRKADGSNDAVFYASFISGILAGAIGSLSVTPLDGFVDY